jgi:BirA family biotin operon repressor/biotin-[acetyl-CoA-carboxylase] ligase
MTVNDRIDLAHTRSAIVGTRFAASLRHFSTVESTNSLLLAAAEAGAPEGTLYVADEQTGGRGRGNHAWHSAAGEGLYLSALVRPGLLLKDALLISLATGLAVQRGVLEATSLELDLRWPNDLMIADMDGGAEKKAGGILVETAVDPGSEARLRYAVIGIGLNVHQAAFPDELAAVATSLQMAEWGRRDDPDDVLPLFRTPILIAVLRALDSELLSLEREMTRDPARGAARLCARFADASTWVYDKRVHVPEQGGYTGTTAGLDARGFLLVDGDDGKQRTVLSGGVRAL